MIKLIKEWFKKFIVIGKNPIDLPLIYVILILLLVGISALFSGSAVTAHKLTEDPYFFLKKQAVWLGISFVFFIVFATIPYRIFQHYAVYLIVLSIILLVLVFIPGLSKTVKTQSGRNFHRWIGFGPLQLQPSEFCKIAVLIYLSAFFVKLNHIHEKTLKTYLIPGAALGVILVLIMLEPALGTTLQITSMILALIFLNGFPVKKLVLGFLSATPLILFLIYRVGYWRKRIEVWLNPYSDKDGDGFQLYSSFRAFMESGWFGNQISTSHSHRSLPYNHTDFILATFVQDYGFVGFLVLLSLFTFLIVRGFSLVRKVNEPFGFLLGSGIVLMISIQIIINLFVVTGLFPITGISLPFMSYGGSSLLTVMISLGILINITKKEHIT